MAGCRLRVLDCVAYVGSFVICFINSVGLTLCISVLFDLCWCDCGFVGCEFLFGFDLWLAVCFGVIWCFLFGCRFRWVCVYAWWWFAGGV